MATAASTNTHAPGSSLVRGRLVPVVIAVALILFVDNVDVSALTVALPVIADELGGGVTGMRWIMNAYFISSASFFLLAGFLGDRFGIRDTLAVGVALIVLASLFGSFAPSLVAVVVWRFVQGIGYAMTFSMMLLLTKRLLPEGKQNIGMGVFMGVATLSSMAGPVLGSALTHHLGWRSLFYVNVILCAPCIWMVLRNLHGGPEHGRKPGGGVANVSLALGLLAGMTLLMEIEPGAAQPGPGLQLADTGPWLLAITAGCLLSFVALNRRLAQPILSAAIFANRPFVGIVAIRVVLQAVSYSTLFWLPIYLQRGLGYGVVDAGLILTAFTATAAAGAFAAGALAQRLGQTKVSNAGHGILALGLLVLLVGRPAVSLTWLLVALALIGGGFSAVFTVVSAALLEALDPGPEGMLVGSYYTISYMAGSLGIAATSFATAHAQADQAGAGAYVTATTTLAGCWLVGVLLSLLISHLRPIVASSPAALDL